MITDIIQYIYFTRRGMSSDLETFPGKRNLKQTHVPETAFLTFPEKVKF